jgi:hypothetical protein
MVTMSPSARSDSTRFCSMAAVDSFAVSGLPPRWV